MYLQQRTWIENGPGPVSVPVVLRTPRRRPRRGVSGVVDDWCGSWWSLSNPFEAAISELVCLPSDVAKVSGRVTTAAADVYQQAVYGDVPTVPSLPPAPAPNAPETQAQMTDADLWTVAQSQVSPDQWNAWSESQRAAVAAAIANGSYNPAGNLPNVTDLSKFFAQYKTPLLVGGAVLGFFVLKGLAGGHR